MANKVLIVGMGMSARDLTPAHIEVIRSAQVLVGASRHLAPFADLAAENREIAGPMAETVAFIRARRVEHRVVVLASGDPLFFGIGHTIAQALGRDQVVILPNVTAIAAAFARINEPWGEAAVVSLHGRDRQFDILAALKGGKAVAVLTDQRQSPQWLAQWLAERGAEAVRMAVFERLGSDEEAFGWHTPLQAAEKTFAQPNVVILKPPEDGPAPRALALGTPDEAFLHENGLITKAEVRAVTLAKLRLEPGLTLWDLGAGSGAVGIEASVLLGAGRIIAVEQHAGRVDQIRQNANRYGVYNHETIQARLPEGLASLPRPDRIFIGGGGRDLAAVVRETAGCLNPGGVMVINTVLLDNLHQTLDALEELAMAPDVVQLQVSRSRSMPWSSRLEAQNPVWIISATR
ncbi:MAG: precorrin-6y C5,15-methyltransferase (decarboxylating) subunit CbiE [Desulfobacterales bacterium]|nr:precorrin-6y C5,15-methyltransferase (decarboxylating) subunit CbiE [Desulfobacterales bacterium]